VSEPQQLTADFQSDASIAAGDDRDAGSQASIIRVGGLVLEKAPVMGEWSVDGRDR